MKKPIPDLWPDEIEVGNIIAPVAILKRQAELLGEKTQNLVQGKVETRIRKKSVMHSFYIVAPALDDYQVRLLIVCHNHRLYPLKLVASASSFDIHSDKELIEVLRGVLTSEETKRIIRSLIIQSQK